jgi:F0F1-type ATP synthase membrane subunit b/b'
MCVSGVRAPHLKPQAKTAPAVTRPSVQFTRRPRIVSAAGVLFVAASLALPVLAHAEIGHKASSAFAEPAPAGEADGMLFWNWANFALLAGGLTYLRKRYAVPYFVTRSREIRENLTDAEEFGAEAGAKVAAIDRRIAGLGCEIEVLRRGAQREREVETERISRETDAALLRIQAQAAERVATAGRAARLELRRYCSELALSLAEQKIARCISAKMQGQLLQTFVADLSRCPTGADVSSEAVRHLTG